MTKLNFIRFLQKLSPYCIKSLDIVYHNVTFDGSSYYRYQYSVNLCYDPTPLVEVLLSLYKLRGNVRSIHLVYFDSQHQREQQLEYIAKDCTYCRTLTEFINSK